MVLFQSYCIECHNLISSFLSWGIPLLPPNCVNKNKLYELRYWFKSVLFPFLADNRCEYGWHFYGGNCYFREGRKKARASWEKAQEICETRQANLVTVNDANEQKFLEGILGKRGSWCGLNNKDNQKELKWVSGEESDFTTWAPNQPRKSKKRRCVHIQVASDNHKWVMQKCAKKYRFTCEKGKSGVNNFWSSLGFLCLFIIRLWHHLSR